MSELQSNWRRWLREPLVHFLILGLLLFGLFDIVKGSGSAAKNKIVVTSGTVRSLEEYFKRTWQRTPTRQELDSLIQDYIKEEIYYREAVAMGLDRDDSIVRRRLRQKMEFVADGLSTSEEPTDKDLQDYLNKHPEKFRIESRYSFSHVYLNPDRHPNSLDKDAAALLSTLNEAGDSAESGEYGDSFILGYSFSNSSESNVERTFGRQFVDELKKVQTRKWAGPIQSGYGLHFVYVRDRNEGNLPPLSEVREDVLREWMAENQKKAAEKFYEDLRSRYKVEIEQTDSGKAAKGIP
jgi:hypothetical protein